MGRILQVDTPVDGPFEYSSSTARPLSDLFSQKHKLNSTLLTQLMRSFLEPKFELIEDLESVQASGSFLTAFYAGGPAILTS